MLAHRLCLRTTTALTCVPSTTATVPAVASTSLLHTSVRGSGNTDATPTATTTTTPTTTTTATTAATATTSTSSSVDVNTNTNNTNNTSSDTSDASDTNTRNSSSKSSTYGGLTSDSEGWEEAVQAARRRTAHLVTATKSGLFDVHDALRVSQACAVAKFDETIELVLNLNVDPRRVAVRGSARLPRGLGKPVRVAVFATGEKALEAAEAGAHIVGFDDLIADINEGKINFDKALATPECEPDLRPLARTLGPKGLMPSAKRGTVTNDIAEAVRDTLMPAVDFRADKEGILHCAIGNASWPTEDLVSNAAAVLEAVTALRVKTKAKSRLVTAAHVCSSMGPGVPVDPITLDPRRRATAHARTLVTA